MMQTIALDGRAGATAPAIRTRFSRRAMVATQTVAIFFSLAIAATAHTNKPLALGAYADKAIVQRLGNQVPLDLKFQDENGQTVTLGSYFDKKPVILSMVYYGCRMMCTLTEYGMVNALQQIQDSIGDQYDILTVSFDPREKSDVAMFNKKTYVKLYGRPDAQQGWHFLVGDVPSIHALTDAVGFHYQYLADMDLFSHPAAIMVLTPTGKVSSYFYGIQFRPQDLHMALVDAANERIANPAEINARMQKGMAGGATTANVNSTAKTQSTTPMANQPLAPASASPEEKP